MPPTPRALVLRLVLGAETQGDGMLGVRELLASCALFGLAANRVRVALARAVASGLLVAPRRGAYALGPAARPLADAVRQWRRLPAQGVDWEGGWLAVHVGACGRSDRAALRAREQAFGVLGLAELERGLHLRPDNLAGGAEGLRSRLQALLPAGAAAGTVFALQALSAADDRRARGLWNPGALNVGYRETTARLSAWLDEVRAQPLEDAAREVFELGNQAIRQLVFDPWLPEPLVDAAARRRFVAAVLRHDDMGQSIWRQYLAAVRTSSSVRALPALPRKHALEALR
jgi:phenylacetic acid degradation operon negative regulatory protein